MRSLLPLVLGTLLGLGAHAAPPLPADLAGDARLAGIYSALAEGYPQEFGGAARNAQGEIVLKLAGREFLYDDGRKKDFAGYLETPDVEDSFHLAYPLKNPTDKLPENFDPGRFRVEEMFKALYGASESEVAKNCVSVDFCGKKVRFNGRCGAAEALAAVSRDLEKVLAKKPELKVYVVELGGTFTWRFIAGTKRLSNHSFGNAIDLNVSKSSYWRWDSAAKIAAFSRADWPVEIIETFEKHGFIWGGKWWHYDTMHFEYRPELIAYARTHPATPVRGPEGKEPGGK